MGTVERFFASRLEAYLQSYHQKKLSEVQANAPLTNQEELAAIDKL